jgi:predicted RNA binding protein YcfA (HicA-like mRNA interferase family)
MSEKCPILRPHVIISVLRKDGFVFRSQKESHAKYSNGVRVVIVPMHGSVPRGTLKNILKQADISLEKFLKLL